MLTRMRSYLRIEETNAASSRSLNLFVRAHTLQINWTNAVNFWKQQPPAEQETISDDSYCPVTRQLFTCDGDQVPVEMPNGKPLSIGGLKRLVRSRQVLSTGDCATNTHVTHSCSAQFSAALSAAHVVRFRHHDMLRRDGRVRGHEFESRALQSSFRASHLPARATEGACSHGQ